MLADNVSSASSKMTNSESSKNKSMCDDDECKRDVIAYETRCRNCKQFLCYRCVLNKECKKSMSGRHDGVDMDELLARAKTLWNEWKERTKRKHSDLARIKAEAELSVKTSTMQIEVLKGQLEECEKVFTSSVLTDKRAPIMILEDILQKTVDMDTKLVDEFAGGLEATTEESDAQLRIGNTQTVIVKSPTPALDADGIAICLTSSQTLVSYKNGFICLYHADGTVACSYDLSSPEGDKPILYDICEHDTLVYVLLDKCIKVCDMDMEFVRELPLPALASGMEKMAVNNQYIYGSLGVSATTAPSDANDIESSQHKLNRLIRWSRSDDCLENFKHPSFKWPRYIQVSQNDFLVVSDIRANKVFMFEKNICRWESVLPACGPISVDQDWGLIWVAVGQYPSNGGINHYDDNWSSSAIVSLDSTTGSQLQQISFACGLATNVEDMIVKGESQLLTVSRTGSAVYDITPCYYRSSYQIRTLLAKLRKHQIAYRWKYQEHVTAVKNYFSESRHLFYLSVFLVIICILCGLAKMAYSGK